MKRNKLRKKLIQMQNVHGKKLGKAFFERDARLKRKPAEEILRVESMIKHLTRLAIGCTFLFGLLSIVVLAALIISIHPALMVSLIFMGAAYMLGWTLYDQWLER